MLTKNSVIYIAGHRGMVGSAILRRLQRDGCTNIITRTHAELDLLDQRAVFDFFEGNKIDCVFLAAARVGGIHANNTYRADFIYENLTIQNNVIWGAFTAGVKKLLFLGSSCIYPKEAPQPIKESSLLTGPLEPTNEPYAIAKISGIKLCENLNRQYGSDYRAIMPTNLYGPNDNYNLEGSHVMPAMIRKFHLGRLAMAGDKNTILADETNYGRIPDDIRESLDAIATQSGHSMIFDFNRPQDSQGVETVSRVPCPVNRVFPPAVVLWGSGAPYREFLHVDDMADACIHVMKMSVADYTHVTAENGASFLNVGTGEDLSIATLANIVKRVVGYSGDVIFDRSKPDGTPKKLLDVSAINATGWSASISLENGIKKTYEGYRMSIGSPTL